MPTSRSLPVILLLFVGSGCAALIYEIVWLQLLQLVIGSSSVSLGVLLGTFMGGMCLGSLAFSRLVSPRLHPLRVYAAIEFLIGLFGLAVLFGMPFVDRFYAAVGGQGFSGLALRAAICAVCLLPPAMLMGATLPAAARWVEASPRGVAWLGFFYGGNIAGAVGGCLLAGFYLLRLHDSAVATYVAAGINFAVGGIALLLARRSGRSAATIPTTTPTTAATGGGGTNPAVFLIIAFSGLAALGAEVVWTRILSLMLGATVYTFSIILAVFLIGLGVGSSAGAAIARRAGRPRLALGVCQLLLAAAVLWSAHALAHTLPNWRIVPQPDDTAWTDLRRDVLRCLVALTPPALLWGASFPLALAAVARPGGDTARTVGRLYAANTFGAIVGAVGFSVLVIPAIGSQHAQRLILAIAAVAAFLAFVPRPASIVRVAAMLVLVCAVAVPLGLRVPRTPPALAAYGRQVLHKDGLTDGHTFVFLGEGANSTVAVTDAYGARQFHVAGKVEASTLAQDMRLQRMLGHLPALVHPNPKSVLIVGCGAGVTAGSFVPHPSIERIVICEIEPLIPKVVARHFGQANHDVLLDKRVQVVYDDARHYILTTKETFDIITSDPIHPWVKGAASLYTKEYFELCRRRLNPGGVITQWVPLYESTPEVVKSELATFFEVFPHGSVWSNDVDGEGYDTVALAQATPTHIDVAAVQRRLSRRDHARVAESLAGVEFNSVVSLFGTYAGRARDLREWLKDAPINRDRDLRLQYLAGLGHRRQQGGAIYDRMLQHRRYPDDLLIAPPHYRDALDRWMRGEDVPALAE